VAPMKRQATMSNAPRNAECNAAPFFSTRLEHEAVRSFRRSSWSMAARMTDLAR
jgi:hypothetical protein